ncbi:hypothetical protein VTI74DRAFT_9579 [Chaetomium olivicolor]
MSTIASPRDPSGPFPRRTNSSIITPTSSSRPSLDVPASASGSPNPSTSTASQSKRATRAALREYYNLRTNKPLPSTPIVEVTDHFSSTATTNNNNNNNNESLLSAAPSELDTPSFDAPAYVSHLLATGSLADLLRTYARVLGEMRALDAEKKALVYDNYSKLIAATETIRRMRATQRPEVLVVGGGSSGGAVVTGDGGGLKSMVEGIYKQAVGLREELRRSIAQGQAEGEDRDKRDGGEEEKRRERTRELAREVVKVPGRLRRLMEEGREEEARREWEVPRRLLERWRELGVGGEDVGMLIEKGDAALKGAGETSEVASTTTEK